MPDASFKLAVQPNEKIALNITYEDAGILVVDKPAGLVTQPGKGHVSDSLLNALFARYGKLLHNQGAARDFGLLHRLDKDTSGLVLIAKMPNAYDALRRDFEARRIEKTYWAIVAGRPQPPQGVIQARLKEISATVKPDSPPIKKVMISRQGQEAISAYKTISTSAGTSVVEVSIKTGRLHQIRAHMLFLNTPVLGDAIYGGSAKSPVRPPRLCLHAATLGFKNPTSLQWQTVHSPLPADLSRFCKALNLDVPAQSD